MNEERSQARKLEEGGSKPFQLSINMSSTTTKEAAAEEKTIEVHMHDVLAGCDKFFYFSHLIKKCKAGTWVAEKVRPVKRLVAVAVTVAASSTTTTTATASPSNERRRRLQ